MGKKFQVGLLEVCFSKFSTFQESCWILEYDVDHSSDGTNDQKSNAHPSLLWP